jgi:hypothetical protein
LVLLYQHAGRSVAVDSIRFAQALFQPERNWERLPDLHRDGFGSVSQERFPVFLAFFGGNQRGMYLLPLFHWLLCWWLPWATLRGATPVGENKLERGWESFLIACAAFSPAAIF